MTCCMEMVNCKESVLEEIRFAKHAVRSQGTREVIDDTLRCNRPSGYKSGEDVVPPFALGDAMEAVANGMRTPSDHNSSGQSALPILTVVLPTPVSSLRRLVLLTASPQFGIYGTVPYLW